MNRQEFRTFCHISEYGSDGYRHLHRMIATSSPLVLWAPSSTLLSSPDCRVDGREFVDYVSNGHIRIVAREAWLMSRQFRDSHPWTEGASWVSSVDDEIKRMAEEDKTKPVREQRVSIAPPEKGKGWAEQYAVENPRALQMVLRAVQSKNNAKNIPAGVLDTAHRYSSNPEGAAVQVLRQAFNHGNAIAFSGASTPFFLAAHDSQFIRWIGKLDSGDAPSIERLRGKRQQNYAHLAAQLLELLRTMEIVGNVSDLRGFVGTAGHLELARWYGRICQFVAEENPQSVDDKLYRELKRRLDDARLENTFRSWLAKRGDAAAFTLGLATGIADLAVEGPTQLTIAGALVGGLPIGKGLLKRLGYISAEYSGPQWPFLYTFGRNASGRRITRLRRALQIAGQAQSR